MKKTESCLTKAEHLEMSRKAWDAYHPHYTSFKSKKRLVEFVHPLADVINAVAGAGLCIKQMVETRTPDEQSPLLSQLPKYMAWVAEKEDS